MRVLRRIITMAVVAACLCAVGPACRRPVPPVEGPGSASSPVPADGAVPQVDCRLITGEGEPFVRIALGDTVDAAHAPRPTNDSERLLFDQLYDTLVRVDCAGQLRPALAAAWLHGADGAWLVTLRDDARFADGAPVTAGHVLAGWSAGPDGDELLPDVARHLTSVRSVDDRTLALRLRDEQTGLPLVLSERALAVARHRPDNEWPVGTRGMDVTSVQTRGRRAEAIVVGPMETGAAEGSAATPALEFLVDPDRDPRDFLDEGIDLLLTGDPATMEYAARLPPYESVPLPWHRTHVLVSQWHAYAGASPGDPQPGSATPGSATPDSATPHSATSDSATPGSAAAGTATRGNASPDNSVPGGLLPGSPPADHLLAPRLSATDRQRLAREAIRGDARGAQGPFWWEHGPGCGLPQRQEVERPRQPSGRILFEEGDAAGQDLAERLVGLFRSGVPGADLIARVVAPGVPLPAALRAEGLAGADLAAARARGSDLGYVLALERQPLSPCGATTALMNQLPWLDPRAVEPLADTRLRAIVRRGRHGILLEGDAGVRLRIAGRSLTP